MARSSKAGGAGFAPPPAQPHPFQRDGTAACQARAGPWRICGIFPISGEERSDRSLAAFVSAPPGSGDGKNDTNTTQVVPSPEPP